MRSAVRAANLLLNLPISNIRPNTHVLRKSHIEVVAPDSARLTKGAGSMGPALFIWIVAAHNGRMIFVIVMSKLVILRATGHVLKAIQAMDRATQSHCGSRHAKKLARGVEQKLYLPWLAKENAELPPL
jgi:hypothetical protein